jgi:hypothetical protein
VRTQARLHADDAARQPLELGHQGQALDLPPNNNLAVSIKANKVEDILADIDADRGEVGNLLLRGIRHPIMLLLCVG